MKKQKWILHIDFDSFFASVEQQTNPDWRGKPLGVSGAREKGVGTATIVASSKEAKKLGIKTGCKVFKAKKVCPGIVITPPNFDRYLCTHKKWHKVLNPFSPIIEIFSIDEAFLDISHWVNVWRYRPDFVGAKIKRQMTKELGKVITSTVGIAGNKTMAKLATGLGKPDGLTVLRQNQYQKVLKQSSVDDICGVGHRLRKRLAAMGVTSAWDLGQIPEFKLRREFGIYGRDLYQMGRGTYDKTLETQEEFPKSIGHSKVLPEVTTGQAALFILRQMCEMVAYRARKHNAQGNVIFASASDPQFHRYGKSQKIQAFTSTGLTIFKTAQKLVAPQIDSGTRFFAVTLAGLIREKGVTLSFLSNEIKKTKAMKAFDQIVRKYGPESIKTICTPTVTNNIRKQL